MMRAHPSRFRILPDDYHVPFAGTARDGRRFFLSEELFHGNRAWVGLFLWNADGSFDEIKVLPARSNAGLPPGQAGPVGDANLVQAMLGQLGGYTLEPIEVEPFLSTIDGVEFGWRVRQDEDGEVSINVEPGDFICYYAPWDGVEYDT